MVELFIKQNLELASAKFTYLFYNSADVSAKLFSLIHQLNLIT